MTTTRLFRKVALERLSSPEQLDRILRVTRPRAWAALLGLTLLLGAICAWGVTGSIPTTASGDGVIVRTGGVLNIVTAGAGVIVEIKVAVGSKVKANDIVATIAQPALAEQIRGTRDALAQAKRAQQHNIQLRTDNARRQILALDRQTANTERDIQEAQDELKIDDEQVHVADQLYAKGLITKQQTLDARQKVLAAQSRVETDRAQLKNLEAQKYSYETQPMQTELDTEAHVQELERNLIGLQKDLKLAANVVSPYAGEVIELKAYPGSNVASGVPILSIQPDVKHLEALLYVPSLQAKDVTVGMTVQVSPSTVKREEFGYMGGSVLYVADYPTTSAALMRNFSNEAITSALTKTGTVTEIRVALQPNPGTPSGYQWSSPAGPPVNISAGTLCNARIVTKAQKPVQLVLPYLKEKLGLS